MAINSGVLYANQSPQVGGNTVDSANLDTRRLYNFSDRVADLAPEESPFFTYLSKVAKVPTDDPVFRFLEDRTKVSWTDRSFYLQTNVGTITEGATNTVTLATASAGSTGVTWLIKGMVVSVGEIGSNNVPQHCTARVESVASDGRTATFKWVNETGTADIDGSSTNIQCQVIGTSFQEGSGSPDVWSETLDNDYGYTQIFKTAAEMTNTSIATRYRGYANEWQRLWNLKLREHKVDIERAMLFGQRNTQGGVNYTEGIVGHIIENSFANAVHDDSPLSYNSGEAYFRTSATSELSYDRILSDFEVLFDPARGGSGNKLALASLSNITFFNKLGGFIKTILFLVRQQVLAQILHLTLLVLIFKTLKERLVITS